MSYLLTTPALRAYTDGIRVVMAASARDAARMLGYRTRRYWEHVRLA